MATRISLLDVGTEQYGDALLCEVGGRVILIDAGHPGDVQARDGYVPLQQQIAETLDAPLPVDIDLLIVSHAHRDHIGCAPELVADYVVPRWAYVPSADLAWPASITSTQWDAAAVAGLREEDLRGLPNAALEVALIEAATLRDRYEAMLATLETNGTEIVLHGDDVSGLLAEFNDIQLNVIGADKHRLELAYQRLSAIGAEMVTLAEGWGAFTGPLEVQFPQAARYRQMLSTAEETELFEMQRRAGAAVNAQSCVVTLDAGNGLLLFAGDMQFADPDVGEDLNERVAALWEEVVAHAPYAFAKLSHHGSHNANPHGFVAALGGEGPRSFGICTGSDSAHHPDAAVLGQLASGGARWVRTDRNGLATVSLAPALGLQVARGIVDDAEPNT